MTKQTIPKFPVYIFDLDGTLVDSARDICGAIQEVLAARGRTDVTDSRLRKYIGRHLLPMFYDLGFQDSEIEPMIAHYRRIYPERKHAMTEPFPGVGETLERLGGRKSTATIKSTVNTRIVLEQFGLLKHFDHVQGTDGFPAKPEPDVILRSLEVFDIQPQDCLFVGDSAADMEAGKRAGVRTCGARYGYGDVSEIAKWAPGYWTDDLRELV